MQRGASQSCYTLRAVPNGEEAIEYLAGTGPFANRKRRPLPVLVLQDINVPKKSGLEVLEWIRVQPHFKSLPVLILTSSSLREEREKARELGADGYLIKPSDPLKLAELVKLLHDRWLTPARNRKPRLKNFLSTEPARLNELKKKG